MLPETWYEISEGVLWCVRAPAEGQEAMREMCVGDVVVAQAMEE